MNDESCAKCGCVIDGVAAIQNGSDAGMPILKRYHQKCAPRRAPHLGLPPGDPPSDVFTAGHGGTRAAARGGARAERDAWKRTAEDAEKGEHGDRVRRWKECAEALQRERDEARAEIEQRDEHIAALEALGMERARQLDKAVAEIERLKEDCRMISSSGVSEDYKLVEQERDRLKKEIERLTKERDRIAETSAERADERDEKHEQAALYHKDMMNVREQRDKARAEIERLTKERDAYKRAKQENDERFMNERDAALRTLAEVQAGFEQQRAEVDRLRALPPPVCSGSGTFPPWGVLTPNGPCPICGVEVQAIGPMGLVATHAYRAPAAPPPKEHRRNYNPMPTRYCQTCGAPDYASDGSLGCECSPASFADAPPPKDDLPPDVIAAIKRVPIEQLPGGPEALKAIIDRCMWTGKPVTQTTLSADAPPPKSGLTDCDHCGARVDSPNEHRIGDGDRWACAPPPKPETPSGLYKRHGELASRLVVNGSLTAKEQDELNQLRADLDINEAFERAENAERIAHETHAELTATRAKLEAAERLLHLVMQSEDPDEYDGALSEYFAAPKPEDGK